MPTPLQVDDCSLRLYYSARDSSNRSFIFYADVSVETPSQILDRPEIPCFCPGSPGYFDAEGVMPTSVMRVGDEVWLYYIGWTVRRDVPYHNSLGLAISRDGGRTFDRRFSGPILGTTANEPLFSSTADVLRTPNGWHMWYANTTEWRAVEDKLEPRYHLRYATSDDGLSWCREGQVALDYRNNEEAAIARATVILVDSIYHMWFCYRSFHGYRNQPESAYHIGYARSDNAMVWDRIYNDPIFKPGSQPIAGVDDVMQAYPAVAKINSSFVLLYNGNGFGQTGVLMARLAATQD